ncbi:HPt (histidine-containing phosphotransfer) domain-containing protein [Marinobacter daqiaonensis]|uniref:HPt (Histidine-containing phosphotransfer) domain-containing protein n=1 Tax=Marinobacter daqiaonensis TaxID=650891 RepID=A0A1I6H6T0_9GAMM|nr:Hpt domain-containing protein [Marinobacter daqiaonensis]SFR50108.1 HPt (histidine-containing phosphotransfer) domain-containing protein [Marinobacter daqiaonensis]
MNNKPHLDEEALAELRDVMEDEFGILIQTYISDSRERIQALHQALSDNDQDAFAKTAHSFKGSSINIGAARLGDLCLEAEKAGREGRLDDVRKLLPELESEFATVRHLMEDSLLA